MRRIKEMVLVAILLLLVAVGTSFAGWDCAERPKTEKDLSDYLYPLPRNIIDQYGYGDRTIVMFNLATLKQAREKHKKQIDELESANKALTARIVELTARPVCDPNEIKALFDKVEALELQIVDLTKLVGELPVNLDINNADNTVIGAILTHTDAINQFRSQIDKNTARIKCIKNTADFGVFKDCGVDVNAPVTNEVDQ